MKKIIGTNTVDYPQQRNFYGLPFAQYSFKKIQNFFKVPSFIYTKFTGDTHNFLWNAFYDANLGNVDMFHFFNAISFGSTPWMTTYETTLPRWGNIGHKVDTRGVRLLAGDPCKKLIALSECNNRMQKHLLRTTWPEFADAIEPKMMVLHPSQPRLIRSMDDKKFGDDVIFTFIGSLFFLKGGKEILTAFDQLYEAGIRNWKLNIISRMELDNYASYATDQDLQYAHKIFARYPNNIFYSEYKPNPEVLELYLNSHVGLLPSYADTYGYSVLEAQSAGCPVITTNIRAFPEINDNNRGWIINVPCDEFGIGKLETAEDRAVFSATLFEQLIEILRDILKNPSAIRTKGALAAEMIEKHYTVEDRKQVLESIYNEITGLR